MIELNKIEQQFLDLKEGIIGMVDFEKWVYANEKLFLDLYSVEVYNDLIILDYQNQHSKAELPQILSIDFKRLEQFQLQEILIALINSEPLELENIQHDQYDSVYDPHYRSSFYFEMNGINVWMNNPFRFDKELSNQSDEYRSQEFKKRFRNPRKFLEVLLENLECSPVKLVVGENIKELPFRDFFQENSGTKEELLIGFEKHRIRMDKEFLKSKMKEYW